MQTVPLRRQPDALPDRSHLQVAKGHDHPPQPSAAPAAPAACATGIAALVPRRPPRPARRAKWAASAASTVASAPAKHLELPRVVAATVSQSCFFVPFTAMQPIIPLLVAEKFDLSAELRGASCAAEGLAKILCAVPLAVCLKSWGRKPVLVQSFWLLALSILALAHNSSVWGLMGGKFLIGLAVVAQNSAMQLYLTDISSTENKSRVMAPVLMAEKLFSVVGPLVGGKLLQSYGVHQAMMKVAAATSMLALINQWMLKETKPTDIGHVPKKTESALKRYKELLQDARIREAVIFSAFYWGIFASVLYCIVPLMLAQVFGYGAWAFSLVLAASNLMCFFCAGPVAQLSDRFGRKAALIPGMLLVGLAPLLLAAVPQLLQNATTSLKPLILSLSVGSLALGMGLVGGALPTIFTDGVPSRLHVESLSFLRASTELGSVLLTLTMSSMVGSTGFTWPLLGGGLCALYAAARFALKYRL